MKVFVLLACVLAISANPGLSAAAAQASALKIRVVVVTAFEIGKDTGDAAGEFQAWATTIPKTLPFPAGARDLRYDPARRMLVLMTGIGTNRAATSVMALGMDPRFDFSHAYWLVAAIAGVNPDTASVGSAAWIGNVVDTDYAYAIDPREAPRGWETGTFPLDRTHPYQEPRGDSSANLFPLNEGLRNWAFALTKPMTLPDTPVLARIRKGYPSYPAAQCPPTFITGDEASGQTFWHGKRLNTHVEKWVQYWTGHKGTFVMTGMEDSGTARALSVLDRLGKADAKRLMVLRTGSNYSVQPKGETAGQSLDSESQGLSALQPALNAAFKVGSRVADEISNHWDRYRNTIPSGPTPPVRKAACISSAG